MPPRWLALSFVAFWIAMTGLFFWRDVLPRLNPTEPLMFPVELVDEAGNIHNQNLYDVGWDVSKNGSEVYVANLEWIYLADSDSFDSHCSLRHAIVDGTPEKPNEPPRKWGSRDFPQLHDVGMESHYYMTRKGQMHSFSVTSEYSLVREIKGQPELALRNIATVDGVPSARHCVPHITISSVPEKGAEPLLMFDELTPAVEVSERNLVLNPLHPIRRFPQLKEDQHWRVTVIDPLAFATLPRAVGQDVLPTPKGLTDLAAFVLEARVEREQQIIDWEHRKVPCRIIRIGEDDPMLAMTIWVAVNDGLGTKAESRDNQGPGTRSLTPVSEGLIIKQEVSLMGDSWVMMRRLIPVFRSSAKINPKKP